MNLQENNIANAHIIYLSKIKPSPFNPRKTFRDADLTDLAESIRAQGVLQPIMVRLKGAEYEIVYGERRYRAALLAGLETIPALVRDLTDDTAMEYALTENIQRTDVSPIEEATAYKALIENSRYDMANLMYKFGKSESYIRSRMRLNSLIPPFTELLLTDGIHLSVAMELCKYSVKVQEKIYLDHYALNDSFCWLKKIAKEVVSLIERNYSTDLNEFFFDKSACYDCIYNTEKHNLFSEGDGCGKCLNTACLKAKNTTYIVERAKEFVEKNPELPLSVTNLNACKDAVDILTEQEYEITKINYCKECPTPPTTPEREDYDNDEQYNTARGECDDDEIDYLAESAELCERYKSGTITIYANIGTKGVTLSYVTASTSTDKPQETPLVKLEKQDVRNKEIEQEKTIADTKKLIEGIDLTNGEFTTFEERCTYFAMLKQLRRENFPKVLGAQSQSNYYMLSDADRMQIINNLTEQTKTIIRRDFILSTFKEAFNIGATENLLMEFAQQHAPEGVAEIKAKHAEVYDKRHARIAEKIGAIQAESTPTEPTAIEPAPTENPFAE